MGLGYLTLDRATRTLSGGEFQRVNLATALGAALVNTLYVLDEPSVGLHPADTERLLRILHKLRDRGNTLVVVEHDPDTIRAADHVVDLGPGAGEQGGEVLYQGPFAELAASPRSITARFLRGEERVRRRGDVHGSVRRPGAGELVLRGATGHNLRDLDVHIPIGCLVAFAGPSGSGKSSLVTGTLHPALSRAIGQPAGGEPLSFRALDGASRFRDVELVDQSPIGRTPRSNPATYSGAMTYIRKLLGGTEQAKRMRLSPKSFSFNSRGGRCSVCEGAGAELLEMQFLADVFVPCPECGGKRFKPLEPLSQGGAGYLRLGQSATTLSGGEAQRLKLSAHLPRGGVARSTGRTLFLFDEPTTGLHLADVRTLLTCLHRLVDHGNTVVVIEHHLSVLASADHLIELGPGGGDRGGWIVARGTPEEVAAVPGSPTAPFLQRELAS